MPIDDAGRPPAPTPGPCPEPARRPAPPKAEASPATAPPAAAPPAAAPISRDAAIMGLDLVMDVGLRMLKGEAKKHKLEAFVPDPEDVPSVGTLADIATFTPWGLDEVGAKAGAAGDSALAQLQAAGVTPVHGAATINPYALNEWIAQPGDNVDGDLAKPFITGKEGALRQAIERRVAEQGGRLGLDDVTALAIQGSGGDVGEGLLTAHNTLRAIARPAGHVRSHPDVVKGLADNEDGEAWVRKHLDGGEAGMRAPLRGEAVADDWYHTFTGAVLTYAATERARASDGLTAQAMEGMRGDKPATWLPAFGAAAQQAVAHATGLELSGGALTHANNALLEQVMYGVIGNGGDFTRESVLGVEPAELLTATRGIGLGKRLAAPR